ncbi:bifunctional fructose-bisphosphatase/inositol-phosphate phosphatase [Methanosalsum natronophilum]|uniref:fructose-bisphosphatase n=1 Tax=Methanosalsum natronophilum TaxID=768733 RepID=A0A424YUE9_9EURY|nr:MAG: bifunctional fructose-bisphosphatase/inositol-phosphate phosphatase [Methanosalsum natronophilum]
MKTIKSNYLDLCNEAAKAVANATESLVGTDEAYESLYMGADGTPTKKIDHVAENALFCVLESFGVSMRVLSEEFGEKTIGTDPEIAVVIDPLDGTYNAAHGIPIYSVSIAIGTPDLSEIWFGYVRNLANNDTYHAQSGQGAYLNNVAINPSTTTTLSKSCMSLYGYRLNVERTVKLWKEVRRIRIFGSVALEICYVAAGKADAFVDVRRALRMTDVAAGKVILEEAGGKVTNGVGGDLVLIDNVAKKVDIVATNKHLHNTILKLTEK